MLLYLLLLLLLFLAIRFNKSETKKLPPSPSKLPTIGHLHQLHGSLHHAFRSLAQKHGPLMWLHLGSVPALVVSSADLARDVTKTFDHAFSSRPELEFPKRLLLGKDIAFAPYGEYWRQVRKICNLQLLCTKKVQSFGFVREEEIALMMERIKESSKFNMVNLSQMFASLSYDIISRVSFGRKYNEAERGKKFKSILKESAYLLGAYNLGDMIPSLRWVNYFNGLNARIEKNFHELDSFFDEIIEEHIENKSKRNSDGGSDMGDEVFVDIMLRMEKDCSDGIPIARENTKVLIIDMFGAGTDTTSIALEWTMSELIRHPKILEEVQKEIREIAKGKLLLKEKDMVEMHYLKAVIKEGLRLHHPGPLLVSHQSTEKVQVQGYDIPAHTMLLINAFAIARDPKYWERPEEFWPQRFLNGSSASVDFKGQDSQFIPFGAGRRGCPGILFATSIIELALANLLNRFDWALPNGKDGKDLDMQEGSGLTVHRKNNLILSPRLHSY